MAVRIDILKRHSQKITKRQHVRCPPVWFAFVLQSLSYHHRNGLQIAVRITCTIPWTAQNSMEWSFIERCVTFRTIRDEMAAL